MRPPWPPAASAPVVASGKSFMRCPSPIHTLGPSFETHERRKGLQVGHLEVRLRAGGSRGTGSGPSGTPVHPDTRKPELTGGPNVVIATLRHMQNTLRTLTQSVERHRKVLE